MRCLLVFMCALVAISALSDEQIKQQWLQFKEIHNKQYLNIVEEKTRLEHFKTNLNIMQQHNQKYEKGEVSWYMSINQFADWSEAEFKHMLNLQKSKRPTETNVTYYKPTGLKAPNAIDWRQHDAVREVKNQGSCGDCWAFSATGSLEGQFSLKKKIIASLSEQQLLDCSLPYGNGDCDQGGSMTNAFFYVKDNGIMTEHDYPYEGNLGSCRYNHGKIVGRIRGQVHVERLNERAFVEAAGTIGPISIGINADHFQFYGGGVFDVQGCPNGDGDLNHGVLAAGYGNDNGIDYWLVKNSWGQEWGEHGFVRMRRGINLCGIAIDPQYPTL